MRIGDGGSMDHSGGYSSAFRMTGRYEDSMVGGFCNGPAAVFPPLGFRGSGFATYGNTARIGGEENRVGGLELVRWPGFYTNSSNGGQESINSASEQLLLLQQHQQQQQQHQEQQLQQNNCNSSGKRRGGVASRPCQDCGNQAKKECMNMRCRTCCRSRGLDCPTHTRSTWVPAVKRRERKQHHSDAAPMPNRARILALAPPPKSPSPNPSNSGTAKVVTTSVGFPSKVRAPVAMKCVKVLGLDERQPHHQVYAYKARVKIADHIFQGMLYDEDVQTSPKRRRAEAAPAMVTIGGGERMPTPTSLASLMEHQPSSGLRFVTSSDSTLLQGGF